MYVRLREFQRILESLACFILPNDGTQVGVVKYLVIGLKIFDEIMTRFQSCIDYHIVLDIYWVTLQLLREFRRIFSILKQHVKPYGFVV